MRPWAITEDQVKAAASAGHVEVAFSLPKWPLTPVITGAGTVTGRADRGVPVIHFGRSVRPPWPSASLPCPDRHARPHPRRARMLIALLAFGGLRIGEVFAMRRGDIDMNARLLPGSKVKPGTLPSSG